MKISINAIKEIYKQAGIQDFLPGNIDDISEKIGAQLGEIEQIVDLQEKYKHAIIATVVSCVDHPNADRLKVCKIDDGGKNKEARRDEEGLIQVVCGAPNVKAGLIVVWLPPGATVPATFDKEPFVLEAREIRGQLSNGMLASASELGISDDHTGILVVDKQVASGESFARLYKLDDHLIEIENKMFTHRPDCFGLLGIARELAGIYDREFKSPDWYEASPKPPAVPDKTLKIEVSNEISQLVPRFCAFVLSDVKVATSPVWLQVFLSKAGIKSINNVVDYTNFLMYFSGQPLHAYDYDKVAKLSGGTPTIKVRLSHANEKIKLLNGKEIIPKRDTIMIATDKHPIGIGGVIGGSDTEVDNSTKNIIIECANFHPYSIRRTSMAHGIFTDAVTRFTKNQSPLQNLAVITKAASDLQYLTGGKIASEIIDIKDKLSSPKTIKVPADFINSRLGLNLGSKAIADILNNVEFDVKTSQDDLEIKYPFWRTDIDIEEDIVEEVGRLYGYDRLNLSLPKKTMSPSVISDSLRLKQQIREVLSALGANEVLNYSFIHDNLLAATGQKVDDSFRLKNALSPDLQYYRQSLTPSILEKLHSNIKLGYDNFSLFELGKVHLKGKTNEEKLPKEFERISLVVTSKKSSGSPAFYTAKKYLLELFSGLGVDENSVHFIRPDKKDTEHPYMLVERSATISLNDQTIGQIGEYIPGVSRALKLPDSTAGFEIDLAPLMKLTPKPSYQPISKYPSIHQDISLNTAVSLDYSNIRQALAESLDTHAPEDDNGRIECLDIFSKDDVNKHTTFRITASSPQRTLSNEVFNKILDKVAADLLKTINAKRV